MSRPVVMEVLPAMTPRVNELLREPRRGKDGVTS